MKLLIGLSALQTIGIAVLIVLTINPSRSPAQQQTVDASHSETTVADQLSTERHLRRIVREELAVNSSTMSASNGGTVRNDVVKEDTRTAEQLRAKRDLVAQRIEGYKSIGAIGESQMDELQSEIADLDEESRKQMMSALIRAMNAGAIKGHL